MFFIFSKLLLYLVFPLTWVLLLLLLRLIVKSPLGKKRLRIAAIIVFYLFSNSFLLNLFASAWDTPPATIPDGQKYSCVIVLGGFSGPDKHEQGYFNAASDRFLEAVSLYRQGKVSHILISGGNGNLIKGSFREGAWAAKELLKMGIPQNAILIENASRNTLENGAFSKRVLDSAGLQPPYVLITSAFHMPRSLWVFRQQHIDVIPYPCNYLAGRSKFSWVDFLPQARSLDTWTFYIKEVFGRIAYYVKSKV